MRVLVTGATGFVGARVAAELVRLGIDLHCLIRPSSRLDRLSGLLVEFKMGELRHQDSLVHAAQGCESCIHLAGISGWQAHDRADIEETIVGGTARLIDALRICNVRRLVYVSSAAAIDGTREPRLLDEESVFSLAHSGLSYAIAKHQAEQLVRAAGADGLEVVIVNPAETYGPNDRDWVTAGAICDLLRTWPAVVVRGGTSLAHVDDVAAGIVAALADGRPGHRYILGGDNLTLAEIARLVLDIAGITRPVVSVPFAALRIAVATTRALGLRPPVQPALLGYLPLFWFMDSSKARRELGYAPRPARATLESVVRWIAEQDPGARWADRGRPLGHGTGIANFREGG